MKRFWYFLTVALAVVFTVSGLITITVRARLLDENLYINALQQSGLSTTVTSILEDRATQGLITLQKGLVFRIGFDADEANIDTFFDRVLIAVLGSLIDNQTNRFVHDAFVNLEVQRLIDDAFESNIRRDLAWLEGTREAHDVFGYIPTPEEIETFRNSSLNDIVAQLAMESTGLNNLPTCINQAEAQSNYTLALSGQVRNVSCTNDEIQPLIDARVSEIMPTRLINRAEVGIEQRIDAFGLRRIIDGVYDISLRVAEFKQSALQLREYVRISLTTAYLALLIGLVLVMVAMLINRFRKWMTLVYVYFLSGLALTLISALYYFIFGPIIVANLPIEEAMSQVTFLTAEEKFAVTQQVYSFIRYILIDVVRYAFIVGLVLVLATLVPLVIMKTDTKKYSKQVKADLHLVRKRLRLRK